MRHNRAGPFGDHLFRDGVHKRVVVRGLVMKHHERPHVGGVGKSDAGLPGGVSPAFEIRILIFSISAIVDEYIGAGDEIDDVLV